MSVSKRSEKYDSVASVGLMDRPYDFAIIAFYSVFTLTTALIDYHNVLAPALGQTVRELCKGVSWRPLNWPPQIVTEVYLLWADRVDPIMAENPVFWQIMEWINVVFLTPGNLIMIYAFVTGKRNFRAFGLIHCTALFYSMFLCLGTGLYGELPAANKLQFTIVYSIYATFPIVIFARLWPEIPNVFAKDAVNKKNIYQIFIQWLVGAHFILFVAYVYHWLTVEWEPFKQYPSWMPYAEIAIEKSNHILREVFSSANKSNIL
ncbi:5 TM domain-containing transmembrane protein [Acrasis kona]|uniref:5 TM domain-containing transmembrane protein n=1 Tax=Acrasis kona TaxID=1008807 RepID=A0AAW2ZEF1_9EUKA